MSVKPSSAKQTFNPPCDHTYDLLMRRRSVKTRDMRAPGPDDTVVTKILAAGMRVPDHGKIAPWRFIVLRGDDRAKLGDVIATSLVAENETSEKIADKMRGYATQAPVLIVAVSCPSGDRPIPLWEQELSSGAACQNMLIAATALGFASQWLTGWASYSPGVCRGLGLTTDEKIAGFMFFGNHADGEPTERPRPDPAAHTRWGYPDSE